MKNKLTWESHFHQSWITSIKKKWIAIALIILVLTFLPLILLEVSIINIIVFIILIMIPYNFLILKLSHYFGKNLLRERYFEAGSGNDCNFPYPPNKFQFKWFGSLIFVTFGLFLIRFEVLVNQSSTQIWIIFVAMIIQLTLGYPVKQLESVRKWQHNGIIDYDKKLITLYGHYHFDYYEVYEINNDEFFLGYYVEYLKHNFDDKIVLYLISKQRRYSLGFFPFESKKELNQLIEVFKGLAQDINLDYNQIESLNDIPVSGRVYSN